MCFMCKCMLFIIQTLKLKLQLVKNLLLNNFIRGTKISNIITCNLANKINYKKSILIPHEYLAVM